VTHQQDTLTAAVAAHLGVLPTAPGVDESTEAARAWVEARRCLTDPVVLWTSPDVIRGTVLYAAILFQKKAAPAQFPGYDMDVAAGDLLGAMGDVYRLVGLDPVVA
jgi:hypothetical protein